MPFNPDGGPAGAPLLHESITAFIARLPHAHTYNGPIPDVDAVLATLAKLNIPEPVTTGKRKGDDSSSDPNGLSCHCFSRYPLQLLVFSA